MHKWVYKFSQKETDGNRGMKDLLGGKGANLAEMCAMGLPVPGGFTITTEACNDYYKQGEKISDAIRKQVEEALKDIEKETGKGFGDSNNPLLFSVRSGARASMPGMMDTVLNLGLNEKSVQGLAKLTNNARFAWDSYRRFIQMFANVVMGLDTSVLEEKLDELKASTGVKLDNELNAESLQKLSYQFIDIIEEKFGKEFPTDPMEQLWQAIGAVFGSWNNARAKTYRKMHGFDDSWGTAVSVQYMVFGNSGNNSATGVCFTRNPSTGEKVFFGEYLINAQGEDVVAGIRTPAPINESSKNDSNKDLDTLEEKLPEAYKDLVDIYKKLEKHYKDMQDMEFTIEDGKLYILQTRNGKRTINAALKIAVDFVNEGLLTKKEALMRIEPEELNKLLHPGLDPKATKTIIATGLPASPGAASGKIIFNSDKAQELAEKGERVLLVRQETSPEDIGGMNAATGVITARGGMTSHAAVVARGMGKPCVAGCSALEISEKEGTMRVGNKTYKEGDILTFDGALGEIYDGLVPTVEALVSADFEQYMSWVDEVKKLGVCANADNPEDAEIAVNFGAEGIGLCRTEHMFFAPERVLAVREMIFSTTTKDREKALSKILPFQRADFEGIFKAMKGMPVTIRLLDPPLHEFLPHKEVEKKELAEVLDIDLKEIVYRQEALEEFNPMLGHRGCRLGISYPEIYRMQVRAIIEAAINVKNAGQEVDPEIMIPLVSDAKELSILRKEAETEIEAVFNEKGTKIEYKIGTMIELPRACITANEIAKHADFFSFGTNDLTQTTYGLSRDDSGKFLPSYTDGGIYKNDPFISIDQSGVGFLVDLAVKNAKKSNKELEFGICGEHGGDPKSIDFCHRTGLDYVSCSPYRIPIARLAAAQSVIQNG